MTPPGGCASRSTPTCRSAKACTTRSNQVTQTRQFDFRLPGNAPRTEAEMVALRGNRAVGDGVTRGQAHTYDAAGRLTSTVDALSNIERYEYDALGDRTRWIDKNGAGWTCAVRPQGAEDQGDHAADARSSCSGEALGTPAPESRARDPLRLRRLRQPDPEDRGGELRERRARPRTSVYDTVGRPMGTLYHGYYDAGTGTSGTRSRRQPLPTGSHRPPTTRWATRCVPASAPA